jgi:hypothetical protein
MRSLEAPARPGGGAQPQRVSRLRPRPTLWCRARSRRRSPDVRCFWSTPRGACRPFRPGARREPLRSTFSPRWRPADEAGTTLGQARRLPGTQRFPARKGACIRRWVRDLSCALTRGEQTSARQRPNHTAIDRPVRANADLDVHCCRKQRAVPFFLRRTAALGGPEARRQARCLSLQQRDDMAGANVEPPLRLDLPVRQQFRRWRLRSERRSICR